jgi:hydrogenase nickel incorporation protein HypB
MMPRTVKLEQDVLAKNAAVARKNRAYFDERGIVAFNLVSSPGSGKTTLLEKTLTRLKGTVPLSAIEGDQETERDAERLRAVGCPVLQINTGAVCHLDAEMVASGLQRLDPKRGTLLFVENVGNLVCPAMFDLGERAKVVVASVTEGEDKPLKYPHMFKAASVLVLNKIDLLPHLQFDVDAFLGHARRVNPRLEVFQVSATQGDGLETWCDWLVQHTRGSGPRS